MVKSRQAKGSVNASAISSDDRPRQHKNQRREGSRIWLLRMATISVVAFAAIVCGYLGKGAGYDGEDRLAHLLLEHLREQGSIFKFRPAKFADGLRGAAATSDVAPGDVVASLPLDEILFADTVALEVRAACHNVCNQTRALLALGIAYERSLGSASKFVDYVATLPETVRNFFTWSDPMLALMEFVMPGAHDYISLEMGEVRSANVLLPVPLDEQLLVWGVAMVQTRAIEGLDSLALFPGADLINHHWDPAMAISKPKCDRAAHKCYMFAVDSPVKEGEQLFHHYRQISNLELLIRYGFSIPENPLGPELTLDAMRQMPPWLDEAGCARVSLNLHMVADETGQVQVSLPEDALRCALAAQMANVSEAAALEAKALWFAGAFNNSVTAGGGRGLAAIATACGDRVSSLTTEVGLQLLRNVANLESSIAADMLVAVQHDLQVLQECHDAFSELAKEAAE